MDRGKQYFAVLAVWGLVAARVMGQTDVTIDSITSTGTLGVAGVFTSGVCTVEYADGPDGVWRPLKNGFTTHGYASLRAPAVGRTAVYRVRARDLSPGSSGFTNFVRSYGVMTTIAGAGGATGVTNKWRAIYEGGPATSAELSTPHIAVANKAGEIYIADKDSHGVRKILTNGTIVTCAGTNGPGNGPDEPSPATQVALDGPNGLYCTASGTVFIVDSNNGKIRRLDTNGTIRTVVTVPGGLGAGRGIWVRDDEQLLYCSATTVIKKWTPSGGVVDYATNFVSIGNLAVDPAGNLVVADRNAHTVWRMTDGGSNRVRIAGSGGIDGKPVDGAMATNSPVEGARGICFLPTGGFIVGCHNSDDIFYIDTAGRIYMLLNGGEDATDHLGDGTWFYNNAEKRVSQIRAVTLDADGNILITENDAGYVRRIQFLPFTQ